MERPTLDSVFSRINMATPFKASLIDTLTFKTMYIGYEYSQGYHHDFEPCFYEPFMKPVDHEPNAVSGRIGSTSCFQFINDKLSIFTTGEIKFGIKKARPEILVVLVDSFNCRKYKRLGVLNQKTTYETKLETLWDFAFCLEDYLYRFQEKLQRHQEVHSRLIRS